MARLLTKNGKNKTAVIPCSNNVFKRLIEIPTRPGNFMLSEKIVLHFLPKLFVKYHVVEKSLLRVTRNADIDTETIYDEDLDYRDAMENLIKQRKRMIPWFLWGETIDQTNVLLVAPNCLQNKILAMMDDEICHAKNGEEAYIGVKINSLTDKDIIEKLVEASQAGVKIEMIVRGICCLIPGIKGYTENIKVISIVGRYLEHSRIYRFGCGNREKVYIASADYMTRNTLRRVEVAVPILDEKLRARLDLMFDTMMQDDEKGKIMTENGTYEDRRLGDIRLDSQELFYEQAYAVEKRL